MMVKWSECVEKMEKLAKEMGNIDIIAGKRVSNHVDDWYLCIAFCRIHQENSTEYVTWLYNATLGDNGSFNNGHYFSNYDNARHDFEQRT